MKDDRQIAPARDPDQNQKELEQDRVPKPEESGSEVTERSRQLLLQAESYFSGPLPPPSLLALYEDVAPGSADRIIRMAEEQGTHRRHLEKTEFESGVAAQTRGQYLAFIVAMVVSVGGIYLLATDHSVGGLVALLTPLAGLTGLFLVNRSRKKERRDRFEADREHLAEQGLSED